MAPGRRRRVPTVGVRGLPGSLRAGHHPAGRGGRLGRGGVDRRPAADRRAFPVADHPLDRPAPTLLAGDGERHPKDPASRAVAACGQRDDAAGRHGRAHPGDENILERSGSRELKTVR